MRPGTLLRWRVLKNIFKAEIHEKSIILDIGSFDGFIPYNIKELIPDLEIIVADIDEEGLSKAQNYGLKTINTVATKLPINDNSIDIVICLDLIEHVTDDFKVINEIARVLKVGGKVILTTPMENGVSFPFLGYEKNALANKNLGHVRQGYSLKMIEGLFAKSNLKVDRVSRYFNLFSRTGYCFSFMLGADTRMKNFFFNSLINLEPYIKYGSQEHIIIGRKEA